MALNKPLPLETEKLRDATYERGWVDSLDARWNVSGQSVGDIYCYAQGWQACADYRWEDPKGRGLVPDHNFRRPRP